MIKNYSWPPERYDQAAARLNIKYTLMLKGTCKLYDYKSGGGYVAAKWKRDDWFGQSLNVNMIDHCILNTIIPDTMYFFDTLIG